MSRARYEASRRECQKLKDAIVQIRHKQRDALDQPIQIPDEDALLREVDTLTH